MATVIPKNYQTGVLSASAGKTISISVAPAAKIITSFTTKDPFDQYWLLP